MRRKLCKHWRCEVENVWNMYSVQIFQEELCCNHHLASSAPCRTSSAWSVNSMAVFAWKKYPLWNTWIGGFRWFHLVSSNIPFQVWYSNCEQTFEGRGYSFRIPWHLACVHAPHPWNDRSLSQTKQGSMYINLLDLNPLAAIDPKNSGVSRASRGFHTIMFPNDLFPQF